MAAAIQKEGLIRNNTADYEAFLSLAVYLQSAYSL